MKTACLCSIIVGCAILLAGGIDADGWSEGEGGQALRELSRQQFDRGNFKEALAGFEKLLADPQSGADEVPKDLLSARDCLQRLGRVSELDDLVERAVAVHGGNWRLLQAAAEVYLRADHHGFIIAGKFHRGSHRGGGQVAHSLSRDRTRALQLLVQAMPLADRDDDRRAAGEFYLSLANIVLSGEQRYGSWRLQTLTDLSALPDYEPGWGYYDRGSGAPVDADGRPVFYTVPASFGDAANDGQRWRWALAQARELDPQKTNEVRWRLASFLRDQFGVQTLAEHGIILPRGADGEERSGDDLAQPSGTYALHTLGENETIARLAVGVRRFELPDEFNHIKVLQQIIADPATGRVRDAEEALGQVFENRRQYPRAAEYWRMAGNRDRLSQIEGNWGRFEPNLVQPAGRGATIEFRFRNGKQVRFTAQAVHVEKLLDDVKAYLKSSPAQLDWQKVNIENIGYRLVTANQRQYLGEQVADWTLDLEPRGAHVDRRITVTTPLQKAGAYLLTAQMRDGNTSRIIVWLADAAIIKKPLGGKAWYYLADANSGAPLAGANVSFFGYRQEYLERNRYRTSTTELAELTDRDGQVIHELKREHEHYNWLVTARARDGRTAYLGFTSVWRGEYAEQRLRQAKALAITDRPVYRPGQTVKFKFWIATAQYDQDGPSELAGREFRVEIHRPDGQKVLEKTFKADEYGGLQGQYELPSDAALGVYQALVANVGGGTFRVEEYKKPEFEVTVESPGEPLLLGEKFKATIAARYYFGAPVTEATVKYKVLRTAHDERWYPLGEWDWLYGPGYWWFGYDYEWYPGWRRWGCVRPWPWWWAAHRQPPEVVAAGEAEIGPAGMYDVEIDTALAQELHGDKDHRYEITAEVVDASRRTIVGQGSVLVARRPFQVFAWVDRGYYRVGDTITAGVAAHRLDRRPVRGKGVLKLLRISYDEKRQPVETPVADWQLDTDEDGRASQRIAASRAGQYRLAYTLTDAKGHSIEGGYVFTIVGEGFDGAQFRYDDLELVPDRRQYRPGETVRLLINTDRSGGTVLLFVRPSQGVYLPPQVVRLAGKSTLVEIPVVQGDMPNFFLEAVTIADGRLHDEARQIVVPPEQRVLNVKVEPSQERYLPGAEASVKLTLTDLAGKPLVGSTVVSIYDKAVEYISGGSNVPDIKAFFWSWRRHHYPRTESSLARYFHNLLKPRERGMANLGVFGETIVDEWSARNGLAEQRKAEARGDAQQQLGAGFGGQVPAAAAMPGRYAEGALQDALAKAQGEAPEAAVQPVVRTQFADTALWVGSLETDGDGVATVRLTMPENLTTWKVATWAMGRGTRVGQGTAEVVTSKNLLVRLQAPRFFVETDEVVLSANVHNYLERAKMVQVVLELDGPTLRPLEETSRTVEIAAGGASRVEWRVKVVGEGEAVVRMKALTDEESDAMQMRLPAYVHGMLKTESVSGALRPEDSAGRFTFAVPDLRRAELSRLEVRWSPTLAGALVDALPYLAEYPYGCTEQTLNRFLPTVITQKVLLDMGLDLAAIRDKRTNLNAQEIGDDRRRAEGWQRFDRNPVFDEQEVRRMVKEGVAALTDMQLSDGGWGWFSGYGERSTPHTTAVVVHGLQIAAANEVALVPGVLERGVAWLARYQDEQVRRLKNFQTSKQPYKQFADNLDALVFMVLVDAGQTNDAMLAFLDRDRVHLAVYAKALFGLALEKLGRRELLAVVLENIAQFVVEDDENQTAHLRMPEDNYWWLWYGSDSEAHAWYLKLLARTDPRGRLAARLAKYVLNNRKHATYWNSTRDTALCIEALADFLRASGEARPEMTVEVWLDGRLEKAVEITPATLFVFDNKLVVEGDVLTAGRHTVELRKRGSGPLYYNGYATNFTRESFITAAGLEVKMGRKFYRLVEEPGTTDVSGARGQAVTQRTERNRREELANLGSVRSGDLIEVELEIDSKNDYEYLIFTDMKAAGLEPVDLRSGYTGNPLGAYVEFRDDRAVFFVRWLARGQHSVAYRLRAEIPGSYSALPARAEGMYAPELRGNSDEMKLSVGD